MIPSAHVDTFTRRNLPPASQWPDFPFTLPELRYPDRFNCVTELLDRWIARQPRRAALPDLAGRDADLCGRSPSA